jgi:hypothetical protein
MRKKRAVFSKGEMETMDKIITTLTIKLYFFVQNYKDHRVWNEDLSNVLRSDSFLSESTIFMNINANFNKPSSPQGINKEIAKKLAQQSETYLKPSALSKLLKDLEERGVLDNIRGKKKVKQQILHMNRRSKYLEKPQGYHSYYKTTDEVEKYKQVLSDPLALEYINERLKNSGLLRPACLYVGKSAIHAIRYGNERTEKFLRMTMNAAAPGAFSDSQWTTFKEALGSVDENELNNLINGFADYMLANPNGYAFLVLALPKLDF